MRKALYIGGGIVLLLIVIVFMFRPSEAPEDERPISTMLQDLRTESVSEIRVSGRDLTVTLKNGLMYETQKERDVSLFTILAENEIDATTVVIQVDESIDFDRGLGLLLNFFPILFLGGIVAALIMAIRRIPRQKQ